MRKKIGASLASLGLGFVGLTATATPAAADVPCTITNFSPHSVTVGLTPTTVQFNVTSSGCELTDWDLTTDDYLFFAYKDSPQETLNPWNEERGYHHVMATAYNADYNSTEHVFANGFTLKRRTAWQSGTFNASPEPVAKGKPITIKGRLMVVDWDNDRYYGYGNQSVKIQFRTSTGTYATVKTVTTRSDGWVSTSVTAQRSGSWRVYYSGHSAAGSSTVTGDNVPVT